METWVRTTLILCVFGFLKEFRPAEPFFTQYLVDPPLNFTEIQVNQQIYPVMTYSQLALLVFVFLLTDLLRYKPVILLESVSVTISSVYNAVSTNVVGMQTMALFYGIYLASGVAYYTYIYAKVDRKHYQKVTSYTRSAFLIGHFLSSVLGQILISTDYLSIRQLIFISIGASTLATIWAFFLPAAELSVYFHADKVDDNTKNSLDKNPTVQKEISTIFPPSSHTLKVFPTTGNQKQMTFIEKCVEAYNHLWKDFKEAFTNMYVLKWSIWWSLATCGYCQAYLYGQVLWETINVEKRMNGEEPQILYNGVVDASYTILGAAAAFGCGWLRLNWEVLGDATLAACALLEGACVILAALTADVYIAYAAAILFCVLYHAMITIVNSEIAKHINEDSYGLIFGVNTFFGLVLQSVLTFAVAGNGGLALSIRPQFLVYGCYFLLLGAIFAVMAVVTWCGGKLRDHPLWLPEETTNTKPKLST